MATKVWMYSATHESVTAPVDRDRKIRTALRTNQIAGCVTVPSKKKKKNKSKNIEFSKVIKDPSCIEPGTKEKETSDIFLLIVIIVLKNKEKISICIEMKKHLNLDFSIIVW